MNGVVFHTSVAMMATKDPAPVGEQGGVDVEPGWFTKPVFGSKAKRHEKAATTVTIP